MCILRILFQKKRLHWLIGMGVVLPASLLASSITISWDPNTEPDLAGYRVHYGKDPRAYSVSIDVGNVTEYQISGLSVGTTYYFAVTAFDENWNESDYSEEVSYLIEDIDPPEIVSVACEQIDRVRVVFNEEVEKNSAELTSNYGINNGIVVQSAVLQADNRTVFLYTTSHANGSYTLTVNNVRDRATVPNSIIQDTQGFYSWSGNDETPPAVTSVELYNRDILAIAFSEALDQASALNLTNYSISPPTEIISADISGTFQKVYLETADHTPGQQYTITISNIKDGADPPNAMNPTSVVYECISEDTDPPILIAALLQGPTELKIEFSESLDPTSAEEVSHYTIAPSVTVLGASLSSDGTSVTLTTEAHPGGTYTVTVSGVGDDANPPNTMASGQLEYTYTPPDVTPPVLESAELTSDDLLQLTFNEPVEESSAENVNNYVIDPPISVQSAILEVSQKMVLLYTDSHSGGAYRVTVNGVRDRAENPNTIAPNSFADYTYNPPDVTPPELLQAELHGGNIVELIFSESLDRTSSENISNYQIEPYVEVTGASLVGDSLNRVYLETQNHQPGQSYTLTVHGIMDRAPVPNIIVDGTQTAYEYPLVDITPPRLLSVELQGNLYLEAVFSEALDQASAENIANYTISPSITVEEVTLDASLKKVFLKTEKHQPATDYTLTVTGVMDLANPPNVIGSENEKSYSCVSQDITPPQLVRAELHGNQMLELTFSEPLDAGSAQMKENYAIDKGISILEVTQSQSQTVVFLETTPHQRGTYRVTVNDVKDMATIPNSIEPDSWFAYTYTPADTIPPALLNVALSYPTMVELSFSEPLSRPSVENLSNYSINNGIVVERAILDVTMTKVFLQTTLHIPGSYTITLNGIQDGSPAKNSIPPNTEGQYDYITEDNTPPVIVSAELQTETMLVVNFSEAMDPTSAENRENYMINNNIEMKDVFVASSEDQVILETSAHYAGEFTLTVNGVKDASPAKNTIAPYSQAKYSWSPPDTLGPALVSANLHTNNYLELTFNEPVDGIESQNIANYSIDPPVQIQNAVLHASLTRVYLFTAAHKPGSYSITVTHVRDRAFTPNPMSSQNRAEYSYTPPDTVPPDLVSVQLRTPMTLALVFDEPLSRTSAENAANYTIEPDINVTQAYLLASLTSVRLETDPHQPGINYKVQIQGIEDRAPIPNRVVEPLQAEYTYTPPDTSPPVLVSVKLHGTNQLELIFSEPLEQTSAENRENYRIDPSVEVLDAYLETTTLAKVYLQTTTHMPGVGYGINVKDVKDRAPIPNTISPNTWLSYSMPSAEGMVDDTPPQVARVDVMSSTSVDIIFTEPVDKATAEDKKNYSIDGNVVVETARIDSDLVRVHLMTTHHQLGKSYEIHVSNIRDRASQPNVLSSAETIKYMLADGATLSNLNRSPYEFYMFSVGGASYVDRDYTVVQAPEYLEGAAQILTANDDKSETGDSYLTFELRGEATVFVAHDKRIPEIPGWLSSWKITGDQVVDSRSSVFQIYSMQAKNGRVTLGGNGGTMDDNMYLLFVVPQFASGTILANLSRVSYQLKHITVGDTYYIDRDYTIASIPDSLKGLLWIQTANDDKIERDEQFLTFALNRASLVYVAYDSRIASLPKWIIDWERHDEQIVDSRGTRFDILYKEFSSEEVVLGGNCGSVDDNMYLVLIKPTVGVGDSDTESAVPGYFTLSQNYPNPFNPETTIRFAVQKAGNITLTVFNLLGQRIKVLRNGEMDVGNYEVIWDGTDHTGNPVASGIYFYRIEQEHFAKTRRMLLIR